MVLKIGKKLRGLSLDSVEIVFTLLWALQSPASCLENSPSGDP